MQGREQTGSTRLSRPRVTTLQPKQARGGRARSTGDTLRQHKAAARPDTCAHTHTHTGRSGEVVRAVVAKHRVLLGPGDKSHPKLDVLNDASVLLRLSVDVGGRVLGWGVRREQDQQRGHATSAVCRARGGGGEDAHLLARRKMKKQESR